MPFTLNTPHQKGIVENQRIQQPSTLWLGPEGPQSGPGTSSQSWPSWLLPPLQSPQTISGGGHVYVHGIFATIQTYLKKGYMGFECRGKAETTEQQPLYRSEERRVGKEC